MIKFSEISQKLIAFSVASTTAGTRFNVAHNLGYAPAKTACRVFSTADDTDTDNCVDFAIVKADATNVVLKPARTIGSAVTGQLVIGLEEMGPVNNARP